MLYMCVRSTPYIYIYIESNNQTEDPHSPVLFRRPRLLDSCTPAYTLDSILWTLHTNPNKMSNQTTHADTHANAHANTHAQGMQTRRAVLGDTHVDNSLAHNTSTFTRPLQDFITEYAWGDVWNRPGLDRKQRSLLNLGMLIALNRMPEFGIHVRGAIRNGVSEVEIREAIVQATVYCGAPAAMEATRKADTVLQEMQENGEYTRVCI